MIIEGTPGLLSSYQLGTDRFKKSETTEHAFQNVVFMSISGYLTV